MILIKMLAMFFILIMIAVFAFVLRIVFGFYRGTRTMRNAFNGTQGGYQSHDDAPTEEKHFSKSDGEYVAFEEIPEGTPTDQPDPERKTAADYRAGITGDEEQITDAQFEEIPTPDSPKK